MGNNWFYMIVEKKSQILYVSETHVSVQEAREGEDGNFLKYEDNTWV